MAKTLTDLALELGAMRDLQDLCDFVAAQAAALFDADRAAVYLETRPLSPTPGETSAQLTVPLRTKGETWGALTLVRQSSGATQDAESGPPLAFTPREERHLTLLASVVAVAVAGLQREQALRRQNSWRDRALDLLQESGRVMGATLELGPLMRRILAVTVEALGAEAGLLALLDDHGRLVSRASAGAISRDSVGQPLALEKSLCGWVTRHGRSALVQDPAADARVSPDHPVPGFEGVAQTLLAVPLVSKGQVIGAVKLLNKQEGTFDQGDRHLLETLAPSAAAAIQNARLYEHKQRQALQQELTIRVGRALSSAQNPDAVLQQVAESALSIIPAAFIATVHLLAPDEELLRLRCSAGHGPEGEIRASFRVGEGIAGHVFATRQLTNVADVSAHPRYVAGAGRETYRSLLVAPLIVEEQTLGTLSVAGREPNAFGRDDEQMMRGLATQAAVALQKAQLYATAEERAAELKAANQQLQDLAQRKAQFVQNTSHELRTPLTFVRGYLELLLGGDLGPLTDEQQSVLEIMDIKSRRLVELVEGIGSLLNMELYPADLEPVNLVEVVARSAAANRPGARAGSVTLETLWPEEPVIVEGNGQRLVQVFNHLLDNAIKFSPDGGEVCVRAWKDKGRAYVRVSDQGIGIPPAAQDEIFDRFYQIDGSTTRRFGGTGLGLAIVKECIEAHGGTVTVESSGVTGEGAAFTVTLPLLSGDATATGKRM